MRELELAPRPGSLPSILCLGAHADDIEIGCGGALLELVDGHAGASVHWVVLSALGERRQEAAAGARRFLKGAGEKTVAIRDFRDGFLPYRGGEIKELFEELKGAVAPDLVFTHWGGDFHQDHRLVSELTWNTFRDHLILEYEVPKYDGDLGRPNVFVPLAQATCERKIEAIVECFPSQRAKHWFTAETFRSLLRLRGIESRSPSGYAEAFYARKLVLGRGGRAR